MDRGAAAAWPAESQLHPQPGAAGASGADAVPQEPDRGMQPGAEPAAESTGRGKREAGVGGWDIQGKSARRLLDRLAAGEPLGREDILPLLYKTLQPKLDDITSSLESIATPLQRALLRQILDHIDDLDRRVAVLDGMVEQHMAEYAQALDAIDEIPGIARRSAQVILAEIGLGMERFPSAAHLCSWAGVSPGNHQSAKALAGTLLRTLSVPLATGSTTTTATGISGIWPNCPPTNTMTI